MDGRPFLTQNTVTFTLLFVITYERTYRGQRVVFKKHAPGLVDLVFFE